MNRPSIHGTATRSDAERGSSNSAIAAFVQLIDIEKTYDGRTTIIDRLNLEISRGEFLTLLGPSGSGKTTCLMMLAGFESWTRGDILLAGRSLRDVPAYRRNIGVVFQNYALFPHMTVAENVAFPLRQRRCGREEIQQRVRHALQMVELTTFDDRPPSLLSGGQQQRVALARALVFEPDLVLMDEPLGALDRRLREQMQLEIKRLHERLGMTVVYVTHDQSEALTLSDRIAVFNAGRIEQVGLPRDIYERPATSFVANFVGDNNRIDCTVEQDGRLCRVLSRDGCHFYAQAAQTFRRGDNVELSVRPELISIDPISEHYENLISATVIDIVYGGDHALLICETEGHQPLNSKVPLVIHRTKNLKRGARISLGWQAADCWLVKKTLVTTH